MLIEGIELRMKDAIKALYADDNAGLETAIAKVTDRAADIRKKIPAAVRGYLEKAGLSVTDNADKVFDTDKQRIQALYDYQLKEAIKNRDRALATMAQTGRACAPMVCCR